MPSAVARHRTACEREWMQKGLIGYAFSCRETPDGVRERADAERTHRVCLQLSRDTGRHARERMQQGRIGYAFSCRETPDGVGERAGFGSF
jgi:predicted DNA-binding transcriptional regulator